MFPPFFSQTTIRFVLLLFGSRFSMQFPLFSLLRLIVIVCVDVQLAAGLVSPFCSGSPHAQRQRESLLVPSSSSSSSFFSCAAHVYARWGDERTSSSQPFLIIRPLWGSVYISSPQIQTEDLSVCARYSPLLARWTKNRTPGVFSLYIYKVGASYLGTPVSI